MNFRWTYSALLLTILLMCRSCPIPWTTKTKWEISGSLSSGLASVWYPRWSWVAGPKTRKAKLLFTKLILSDNSYNKFWLIYNNQILRVWNSTAQMFQQCQKCLSEIHLKWDRKCPTVATLTTCKATQQNFPQIFHIKITEVNNQFSNKLSWLITKLYITKATD